MAIRAGKKMELSIYLLVLSNADMGNDSSAHIPLLVHNGKKNYDPSETANVLNKCSSFCFTKMTENNMRLIKSTNSLLSIIFKTYEVYTILKSLTTE